MVYELTWMDATKMEHYKNEKELLDEYKDMNIIVTKISNDGVWFDYICLHTFEAENNTEAINYVKEYNFGMRNNDVFTLKGTGENTFIWTEKD